MDSHRVLRNAVATLVAAMAITGGCATSARAAEETERADAEAEQQEPPSIEPPAQQETGYEPPVPTTAELTGRTGAQRVYHRRWKTSARPSKTGVRMPTIRNKAIAFRIVVQRAWTVRQFRCLDSLWTRESGWNHKATNGSSGAYGIPQALPATKMAGAGGDWRSNPATQIKWGLTYIKGRYGSPCGAWGHFQSHNWY
ncbi:transglycosylase SLT domain-containing protein [Spongiactinospora sp. TRM90649]|uniref:aggregation-promoting factor C-terminal-like domain-containing protein n=1 Tax=Spongiactinospora sp. TRM90649 TaxID=3031114 RepID=UPI0023FA1780|nr:transglycosylase SLT domain-containing protein [Spongiactinospora sp. TRM90649]MDF5752366.1 transglycosylase SLT domain-containing protein [Spongiactinospora sp. TRM90649]